MNLQPRQTLRTTMRWATAFLFGLAALSAQAAPLNLLKGEPDITSSGPTTVFEYVGGVLTVGSSGSPVGLTYQPNLTDPITNFIGTWELTANVSSSGVLSSGSLVITNSTPLVLNFPSLPTIAPGTTLLQAQLTEIGFQLGLTSPTVATGAFEFLGNITSSVAGLGFGDLSGTILGGADFAVGTGPGEIADVNNPFAGDFSAIDPEDAVSDTFSVPSPAPLGLMLLGGVAMLVNRRRAVRRAGQVTA